MQLATTHCERMGLTVGGACFGPLHNIVSLCIRDWQSAEMVSLNTRLPIETVWFVLYDLRERGILQQRKLNGDEYRVRWTGSQQYFDEEGCELPALSLHKPDGK